MRGREKHLDSWRGDAMRRMAAIHAELHRLKRGEMSAAKYDAKTKELKDELAALMETFLS